MALLALIDGNRLAGLGIGCGGKRVPANAIVFEDVTKRYKGVYALRNASFSIPEGRLVGLIGPNGAGKTTTLKIILGSLRPDSGRVEVLGYDPWLEGETVRMHIGFLPERPIYPRNVRVYDLLKFVARLRGASLGEVERIAKLAGITRYLGVRVWALSRGYLQRLGLAIAFIGDPDLLLLDEPTANLDPGARMEVLDLIRMFQEDLGSTAIVSSHILPELERIVNYVVFIDRGRIVEYGDLRVLAEKYRAVVAYTISSPDPQLLAREILSRMDVRGLRVEEGKLVVEVEASRALELENILEEYSRSGLVEAFEARGGGLEDFYRKVRGKAG